jgi:hypothetical protein
VHLGQHALLASTWPTAVGRLIWLQGPSPKQGSLANAPMAACGGGPAGSGLPVVRVVGRTASSTRRQWGITFEGHKGRGLTGIVPPQQCVLNGGESASAGQTNGRGRRRRCRRRAGRRCRPCGGGNAIGGWPEVAGYSDVPTVEEEGRRHLGALSSPHSRWRLEAEGCTKRTEGPRGGLQRPMARRRWLAQHGGAARQSKVRGREDGVEGKRTLLQRREVKGARVVAHMAGGEMVGAGHYRAARWASWSNDNGKCAVTV